MPTISHLPTPDHAFSRLFTPSHTFSRLLTPSHAFPQVLAFLRRVVHGPSWALRSAAAKALLRLHKEAGETIAKSAQHSAEVVALASVLRDVRWREKEKRSLDEIDELIKGLTAAGVVMPPEPAGDRDLEPGGGPGTGVEGGGGAGQGEPMESADW